MMLNNVRLSLLVLFVLSGIVACEPRALQLSDKKIATFIVGDEIDFKVFVPNEWDRAVIFPPYTPKEKLKEVLGQNFKYPTTIETDDSINLVVFLKEEKVVNYCEISRQQVDFESSNIQELTYEDSTVNIKNR